MDGITPGEVINIAVSIGGFVAVYVRIVERLTRLEENYKHVHNILMGKYPALDRREGDHARTV